MQVRANIVCVKVFCKGNACIFDCPQHKILNKYIKLSFLNPQRCSFSRGECGSVRNVKSHVTKEHCVAQKSKKMVIFFGITISLLSVAIIPERDFNLIFFFLNFKSVY